MRYPVCAYRARLLTVMLGTFCPSGPAVAGELELLVSDFNNDRILRFDAGDASFLGVAAQGGRRHTRGGRATSDEFI